MPNRITQGLDGYGNGYDSSGINPNNMYSVPKAPSVPKSSWATQPVPVPAPVTNPGSGVPTATSPAGLPVQSYQTATTPQPVVQPTGNGLSGFSPANVTNALSQQAGGPATGPTGAPTYNPANIIQSYMDKFKQTAPSKPVVQDYNQLVQDSLSSFENAGSRYMTDAARRGLDTANARGLGNSSIAAGASQRAALEAVTPFVNQALGLNSQREAQDFQSFESQLNRNEDLQLAAMSGSLSLQQAKDQMGFQGTQADLDRLQQSYVTKMGIASQLQGQREGYAFQGEQAAADRQLKKDLQQDTTFQQDWLSSRDFQRQFNATLSMTGINNAYDLSNMIAQYAASNPEIYTPEIVSGLTNFFQNNALSIMAEYFPQTVNTGGAA